MTQQNQRESNQKERAWSAFCSAHLMGNKFKLIKLKRVKK